MIATDQANRLANYSNYGHHNSDIAAPGSQILSTILHGQARTTMELCQARIEERSVHVTARRCIACL